MESGITDWVPLTKFDEDGYLHYPQIWVDFGRELTVEEKTDIAQKLNKSKITEFSIDGDYFIVSLLDFDSETEQQKLEKYEDKKNTIAALFRGKGGKDREGKFGTISVSNRKSKYVGARNEGDEQSQTREYDRSDLFETPSSRKVEGVTPTVFEQGLQNQEDILEAPFTSMAMAVFRESP